VKFHLDLFNVQRILATAWLRVIAWSSKWAAQWQHAQLLHTSPSRLLCHCSPQQLSYLMVGSNASYVHSNASASFKHDTFQTFNAGSRQVDNDH